MGVILRATLSACPADLFRSDLMTSVSSTDQSDSTFVDDAPPPEDASSRPERCYNCGAELTGSFCHRCGQRAEIRRLTIPNIFTGVIRRAFDLDNAYLRTFLGMICHPGRVAAAYVCGKRKSYTNPLKFLIFTITLTLFLRWGITEIGLWDLPQQDDKDASFIGNYRVIYYIAQQTLLAITLALLFYRSKRNLAENIALSLFVGGTVFFYMTIAQFIGFHAFGYLEYGQHVLIVLAYVGHIQQAGLGFYEQRALFSIPKLVLAAVLSLFGSVSTVAIAELMWG